MLHRFHVLPLHDVDDSAMLLVRSRLRCSTCRSQLPLSACRSISKRAFSAHEPPVARAECRIGKVALVALFVMVALLGGHVIHEGHNGRGNPLVWLFGRLSISAILFIHPYYQVITPAGDLQNRCARLMGAAG